MPEEIEAGRFRNDVNAGWIPRCAVGLVIYHVASPTERRTKERSRKQQQQLIRQPVRQTKQRPLVAFFTRRNAGREQRRKPDASIVARQRVVAVYRPDPRIAVAVAASGNVQCPVIRRADATRWCRSSDTGHNRQDHCIDSPAATKADATVQTTEFRRNRHIQTIAPNVSPAARAGSSGRQRDDTAAVSPWSRGKPHFAQVRVNIRIGPIAATKRRRQTERKCVIVAKIPLHLPRVSRCIAE